MSEDMNNQTHILVVDDNPNNLRLLTSILKGNGFVVRSVKDGQSALNSAIANPPDLVLLDIMMPGMDGYETCERIKADERIRDVPVIFVSALNESFDKVRAFASGGVDYVGKPFNNEELMARILTHISLRNARKNLEESNARLQREIRERERAEEKLRQQNEYLTALHQISIDLISHLDLEDQLQDLLRRAADLIGASDGFIHLYDAEKGELEIRYAIGGFAEFLGFRTKPGEGLAGKVWQSGHSIRIDDYRTWQNRLKKPRFDRIRSIVGIPLGSKDRVEGVIGLGQTGEDKKFRDEEIEILEFFGKLASIALEKAGLYASMNREIVRREQVEKELRQANEFMENIFENSADIIAIVDKMGRFVRWNKMAEAFFGYRIDELKGRSAFTLYPDKEQLEIMLGKLRNEGVVKRHEIDMINKTGDILPTEISISILRDEDRKMIGSAAVVRDLSDLKKMLNETRKAHQSVETANKKINESLQYAAIIQRSLLPNMENIKTWLPDSFLIWEPRDIVGGDMIFIDSFDAGLVVAVVDCTGHGIPGGFMTMIASSGLRRITKDENCHGPAEILKRLNFIVKTTLQQDTEYALSDDGLEAGICFVHKTPNCGAGRNLTFAGANMPLTCYRNGDIGVIKGNRQLLGYKRSDLDFTFTEHTVEIEKGMSFYLHTDGFTDQLGGEKEQRFGKARLRKILPEIAKMDFGDQKKILVREFIEYMGENEKLDDVTVFGFGFP